MKSMTCEQLGGPCSTVHRGEDHDAIINAQDQHLEDAAALGDDTHRPALEEMQGRWKRPVSGLEWYFSPRREVAEQPDVDA